MHRQYFFDLFLFYCLRNPSQNNCCKFLNCPNCWNRKNRVLLGFFGFLSISFLTLFVRISISNDNNWTCFLNFISITVTEVRSEEMVLIFIRVSYFACPGIPLFWVCSCVMTMITAQEIFLLIRILYTLIIIIKFIHTIYETSTRNWENYIVIWRWIIELTRTDGIHRRNKTHSRKDTLHNMEYTRNK